MKRNRDIPESSEGRFKINFVKIFFTSVAFFAFESAIPKPTQAQIDQALEPRVSCNFDERQGSTDDAVVFEFLNEQQERKYGNAHTGRLDVNFKSKNVHFNRLDSYVEPSGVIQLLYASAATPQQLENLMRSKGWEFSRVDGKEFQSSQPIAQALKMDMQYTTRVVILPGLQSSTSYKWDFKAKGASILCFFGSTTESKWNNRSGLPTYNQMLRFDEQNKPYPIAWIEPIIAKGTTSAKLAIVRKAVLTDNQVHQLWQDKAIQRELITYKFDQLTLQHLMSLVLNNQDYLVEHSIAQHLTRLPAAYLAKLKSIPKFARMVATAERQPETIDDLVQALKKQDDEQIRRFIALYREYDDLVVDAIFTHGADKWKMEAADRRLLKFTPAQIERALTDPNEQVQIWMLRRKDTELTRAQYDRGLRSKQPNLVFWYQTHEYFVPTSSQIDEGLDHPDEATRWSWATRKDVVLTPAQLAKVLNDPSLRVRYSIWNRTEWTPSEADIDRCFAELTGYDMRTCFSRNDFELKLKWFNLIVRNENRNVIRAWYKQPRFSAAVHAQMVSDLALQADDSLLNVLMNSNDLIFDAQHVLSFPPDVTPNTIRRYCSYKRITCR